MLTFKNSDAVGIVQNNLGEDGVKAITEGFGGEFLPFGDLEGQVKEEVNWLKANKAIAGGVTVSGWVYEVETGKTRPVV
jgi:carbonic anhydrase